MKFRTKRRGTAAAVVLLISIIGAQTAWAQYGTERRLAVNAKKYYGESSIKVAGLTGDPAYIIGVSAGVQQFGTLGFGISFNYMLNETGSAADDSSTPGIGESSEVASVQSLFYIGPYMEFSLPISDRVNFFFSAMGAIGQTDYNSSFGEAESFNNVFGGIELKPAVAYVINERVDVRLAFGYLIGRFGTEVQTDIPSGNFAVRLFL